MIRSRSSKKLESLEEEDIESLSPRPRPRRNLLLVLIFIVVLVFTAFLILPERTTHISNNKPPLVDRKILHKLQSLDDEFNHLEPSSVRQWPPKVTRIPEPQLSQHPLDLPSLVSEDRFCASTSINPTSSSCQFLLPLWISEQESKARIHILQLLQLARSLNRTLVLPNASKSRLGACLKWDFDVYYDKKHLLDQAVDVISMDRFKLWMNTRSQVPIGQLVSLNWTAAPVQLEQPYSIRKELEIYVHNELAYPFSKRAYCLSSKFHRLDIINTYYPLSIVFTSHAQAILEDGSVAQTLIEELTDENTLLAAHRNVTEAPTHSDDAYYYDEDAITELLEYTTNEYGTPPPTSDVLIINWDLRLPLFSSAELPILNYSPRLQALTTRLIKPISPYLAVHWRMESVPPDVLPSCAQTLVSTLHDILLGESNGNAGIEHIWFATDVPTFSTGSRIADVGGSGSGTFKTLTEEHMQAIRIFKDAFESSSGGSLSQFKLTGLREELGRMVRLGEEMDDLVGSGARGRQEEVLLDSGVLGILDKLVAMRAAVFVSGGNGCGRISSFTKQIVDWREQKDSLSSVQSERNERTALRNAMYTFG